jgi:hypothetical protein
MEAQVIRIAYLTDNVAEARDLQSVIKQNEDRNSRGLHLVYPVSTRLNLIEKVIANQFDAILMSEHLTEKTDEFCRTINSAMKSAALRQCPLFLVAKRDLTPSEISIALRAGYLEVMRAPLDLSLVLQKLQNAMPGKGLVSENQLYRFKANNVVMNVGFCSRVETISENGATILSSRQYSAGTVTSLYCEAFNDDGLINEVVSRVMTCSPAGEIHGIQVYRTEFSFQGVTPKLSQLIRCWIRMHSASITANVPKTMA